MWATPACLASRSAIPRSSAPASVRLTTLALRPHIRPNGRSATNTPRLALARSRAHSSSSYLVPPNRTSNRLSTLTLPSLCNSHPTLIRPSELFASSTIALHLHRRYSASPLTRQQLAATLEHSSAASTSRLASPEEAEAQQLEREIPGSAVSNYLLVISSLVFAIVVVGGLTRLTESGLSITEWNVVTGTLPPLSAEAWDVEFSKYKESPEFKLMNPNMTMSEFKTIFLWEYSHRLLGRVIGMAFLLPIPFLVSRRLITPRLTRRLLLIGGLIGAQGALGWYMVRSGLEDAELASRDGIPRVSQYRLAAHLGMAFLVYLACLRLSLGMKADRKLLEALRSRVEGRQLEAVAALKSLQSPGAAKLRRAVGGVTGLVFLTAMSGAFVAGLDAGLICNTFPDMNGHLIPPSTDLISSSYSKLPTSSGQPDLVWRNMLENPFTVQFEHRLLATGTFLAICGLFLYSRRFKSPQLSLAASKLASGGVAANEVPKLALSWIKGTMHMAVIQVTLGITTVMYLVPIPLAALHQSGSLVLLSLCMAAGTALRRPNRALVKVMDREVKKLGGRVDVRKA